MVVFCKTAGVGDHGHGAIYSDQLEKTLSDRLWLLQMVLVIRVV